MFILFSNKGYILRTDFTDDLNKASKFYTSRGAMSKARKVMQTGKVNFISLMSV